MDKMQESIKKDQEKLKNKHAETNNTITESNIFQKDSIAEHLKQKNETVSWKLKWQK